MNGAALAIVDDAQAADRIATIFKFIGQDLTLAQDLASAQAAVQHRKGFVICLLMLRESEGEGALVAWLNKALPGLPVYLLRQEAEVEAQSLPKGVSGQMSYPLEYRRLLGCIRQAEMEHKSSRGLRDFSSSLTGCSPPLKEVQALIRHVAMTDANVLLLGESGTGKEVVARGIHALSLRTDKPFVAVNCGAIPAELLESELFGHEKGAFSGAVSMRRGRFELAEGGTLFLDEIGDMPMPMQVKLLRVIQERTFERVGGDKTLTSNVRIIAATHQNLERQIEEGKFRLDLFYRLNVFPIELPALRDRPEDIPLLIREFATRMELEHSSPIDFDESAIASLSSHPLPGNVRELENLVERLAILYPGETITHRKLPKRYQLTQASMLDSQPEAAPQRRAPSRISVDSAALEALKASVTESVHPRIEDGLRESVVTVQDLPLPLSASIPPLPQDDSLDLKQYLNTLEKTLIEQALEKSDWVVAKAAKHLSLQRTTLVEKIKKYDLQSVYQG